MSHTNRGILDLTRCKQEPICYAMYDANVTTSLESKIVPFFQHKAALYTGVCLINCSVRRSAMEKVISQSEF